LKIAYEEDYFVFQVDLALNVEKAFPRFIRKRLIPEIEIRHPNWMREKLFSSLDGEDIRDRLRLEKASLLCLLRSRFRNLYRLVEVLI
jgi:hypothetical protein